MLDVISGGVTIFHKARGKGKVISGSGKAYFDGYDNQSNLFADGFTASGAFGLAELKKGSRRSFPSPRATRCSSRPGAVGRYVSDRHRSGRRRNLPVHGQWHQRDIEGHRFTERHSRLRRVLDRKTLCLLRRCGQQRWRSLQVPRRWFADRDAWGIGLPTRRRFLTRSLNQKPRLATPFHQPLPFSCRRHSK